MSDPFIDQTIGGFRIVRRIGRGGMGLVFEADEVALRDRRVALKILPLEFTAESKAIARFKREAEIAASLDHPNIVSVYAVGEEAGRYYYAMKYIDGCSLAQMVAAAKSYGPEVKTKPIEDADQEETVGTEDHPEAAVLLYAKVVKESESIIELSSSQKEPDTLVKRRFQRAAEIIAQGAEGLEYAHQRKVIHRDIKPGNLMIDEKGNVLITDFGLATDIQSQTLTISGSLIGTPAYMSPEQVAAARIPIDHRTDIYSLGATLYELLTLKVPFEAETREKLLQYIMMKEPKPPQGHDKRVPLDLDTIAMKALEKDVDHRYQSAGEMAEDLRRYLAGEMISARPIGLVTRTIKRIKRHQVIAVSIFSAAAVALVAIVLVTVISFVKIANERNLAIEARDCARRAEQEAAIQRNFAGDKAEEAQVARKDAEAKAEETARQKQKLEIMYDDAYRQAYLKFTERVDPVGELLIAIKGRDHALEHKIESVPIWKDAAWHALGNCPQLAGSMPPGHSGPVRCVSFSPDGATLASAGQDRTIKLWNVATGTEKATLKGHSDWVRSISFSPNGAILASGSNDKTIKLWNAATGREKATLKGHSVDVVSVRFSPDGSTLASGSLDDTIKLWDAVTGREKATLQANSAGVTSVSFSPDGLTLASGGGDNTIKLWNVATGQLRATLKGLSRRVTSVCFSPDGATVAAGSGDGTIGLWDVATSREKAALRGHSGVVETVSFSPDGSSLASGGEVVKIWNMATGREKATLRGHIGFVTSVGFNPDSTTLA